MKSRQSDLLKLKLETVKTISTFRKINAILLNIKLNRPKLVSFCGYILAAVVLIATNKVEYIINWQNFTEIYLAYVKILQKVLGGGNFTEIYLAYVKILQKVLGGGYFFDSHCRRFIYGVVYALTPKSHYSQNTCLVSLLKLN